MKNEKSTPHTQIKSDELNNMVLTGLKVKATWQMRWDNTQAEPVNVTVEFDFDGVVLGRMIDESVIKHLKVVFAQRHKPKFANVDDFINRTPTNMKAKVADLLSPMARTPMTNLEKGERSVAELAEAGDFKGLANLKAKIEALEAERLKTAKK